MQLATPLMPTGAIDINAGRQLNLKNEPESLPAQPHSPRPPHPDPPSIALPLSPTEGQDNDHDNQLHFEDEAISVAGSPTLSQIMLETNILEGGIPVLVRQSTMPEVFASELHHVEMQLSQTQHAVEDGELALERLEGLVRVLHPP